MVSYNDCSRREERNKDIKASCSLRLAAYEVKGEKSMDFMDLAKKRFAVRKYSDTPVEKENHSGVEDVSIVATYIMLRATEL